MGQSAFADALVQTLLGWLRWLADIAWSLLQGGSGFLRWFSSHWVGGADHRLLVCGLADLDAALAAILAVVSQKAAGFAG